MALLGTVTTVRFATVALMAASILDRWASVSVALPRAVKKAAGITKLCKAPAWAAVGETAAPAVAVWLVVTVARAFRSLTVTLTNWPLLKRNKMVANFVTTTLSTVATSPGVSVIDTVVVVWVAVSAVVTPTAAEPFLTAAWTAAWTAAEVEAFDAPARVPLAAAVLTALTIAAFPLAAAAVTAPLLDPVAAACTATARDREGLVDPAAVTAAIAPWVDPIADDRAAAAMLVAVAPGVLVAAVTAPLAAPEAGGPGDGSDLHRRSVDRYFGYNRLRKRLGDCGHFGAGTAATTAATAAST
jgi:hypothetical protein